MNSDISTFTNNNNNNNRSSPTKTQFIPSNFSISPRQLFSHYNDDDHDDSNDDKSVNDYYRKNSKDNLQSYFHSSSKIKIINDDSNNKNKILDTFAICNCTFSGQSQQQQ